MRKITKRTVRTATMKQDLSIMIDEPDTDSSLAPMDVDFSFLVMADGKEDPSKNESFQFSLPSSKIEVVKRYRDWCILSVTRGNGPRVVEEWIAANESLCFDVVPAPVPATPPLLYSSSSTSSSEDSSSKDDVPKPVPPQTQIAPVLANPHNAACAHSLLLAARNPWILKNTLTHLRVTAHCLVKGFHKPSSTFHLDEIMNHGKIRTSGTCLEVVPSNTAGHISLLVVYNDEPWIAPRQFRRHLEMAGWPVLGGARDCWAFRGEKMCLSVVGLEFQAAGIATKQAVTIPPVPKLRRILQKEERFWRDRQGVDQVRVELFTNQEIPRPIEYQEEVAVFDGLEFRVTPEVMIPRKGTEALVDRVEAHFINQTYNGTSPNVLDLGTGCGNLLLAILKRLCHFNAVGIGIEASKEALELCDYNIAALGMSTRATACLGRFAQLSSFQHEPFDVVVCNPPYIARGGRRHLDAATLMYEPERALFVDRDDPNVHYEDVLSGLIQGTLMAEGALLVFEVCKENADTIAKLMECHNLEGISVGRDINGCIRTVEGVYIPASQEGKYSSD